MVVYRCERKEQQLMGKFQEELKQHDLFYTNFKVESETGKYYIYDKRGRKIVNVKKPEKKGLQDIGIYTMIDKKLVKVLSLKTKKPVPADEYLLYDEKNNLVATYRNNGTSAVMQSIWFVDSNCRVVEKALFRKIIRLGIKKETYIESDFDIFLNDIQIGTFIRSKKFGNKNILDLTMDKSKNFERVVALGLAIVLDMFEK
jgi:hypothetical protein